MIAKLGASPRFVVRELGPRDFVIHDNVTQLDYDPHFTRKAAQEAADRRNSAHRAPGSERNAPGLDELDRLRDEVERAKAELEDVRYNLGLRAFTAPDEEFEVMFASLDARIRDALNAGKAA